LHSLQYNSSYHLFFVGFESLTTSEKCLLTIFSFFDNNIIEGTKNQSDLIEEKKKREREKKGQWI